MISTKRKYANRLTFRLRYNGHVTGQSMSRRRFLRLLPAAAGGLLAPPTPPVPAPYTREAPQYFVPLADYHELPAECYAQNLIRPFEIIVHWDGNRHGRDLWLAPITFDTLRITQQSSHFAVDYRRIWQMLPMYATVVQESFGAMGFNWASINVEMAGTEFDLPDNQPPESEIQLTVRLVSQLMDFYDITFAHVAGHFERDSRGDKRDPGVIFMAAFRQRLTQYRANLSPLKRQALGEP